MPAFPQPPAYPEDLEAFATHAQEHPALWYDYWQKSYEWMTSQSQQAENLQEKVAYLDARSAELDTARILAQGKYEAILERYKEKERELEEARQTRLRTVRDLTPSSHYEVAEPNVVAALGTTPLPAAEPTASSHLSERQPDPDRFSGDRKDLRRFTAQIRQKLNVNRDRFPTPQSRMTYVSGRLLGTPYGLVLPYITGGRCTLPDYESILHILEQAYGDPNRIRNAREELYRIRQKNRGFSEFLADFQRLAVEGEVADESKRIIMDQAISNELKDMLVHHDPPTGASFNEYTSFLQGLENRIRKRYAGTQRYQDTRTGPAVSATPRFQSPTRGRSPPNRGPARRRSPSPNPINSHGDPMDLSNQRRRWGLNRKDNNLCFRCGSGSHYVRDCPEPDTRGTQFRSAALDRRGSPANRSPMSSPRRSTPSPDRMKNGVSLS